MKRRDENPPSPFGVIFYHAWKRVGESVWLNRWEALAWSVYLLHLAFASFGFHVIFLPYMTIATVALLLGSAAGIFSFLLSGLFIKKVHMDLLPTDPAVRIIPISPWTVVTARILSVLFLNVRLFLPLVLLGNFYFNIPPVDPSFPSPWAYIAFESLCMGLNQKNLYDSMVGPVSLWIIACFVFQVIGCVVLPVIWAAFWGTVVRRNTFLYFLLYFSILLLPITLALLLRMGMDDVNLFLTDWPMLAMIGISGMIWIIPALLLLYLTVRLVWRRSG